MDLIPDLPRDVALQCLIRVPANQFQSIGSVCKAWKAELELPEFLRLRKSTGKSQTFVVLSQAQVKPTGNRKGLDIPVYRLVVLEPETGCWAEMPPLPEFSKGLPLFCRMAAVGSNLVVMGGYDPQTWECLGSVFLFDFLSSTWRRGADMPGGPRSFFGCDTDGDRTVFVAGGHDVDKNALKSAWTYDVTTNNWSRHPDMIKERDECKALFYRGKFHVINGYPTDMQGVYHKSIEIYDTSIRRWSECDDVFSDSINCPKTYVEGTDQKIYTCHANDVVVLEDDKWHLVTRSPVDAANRRCLIALPGQLLLIGASNTYRMDLSKRNWIKACVSEEFSGHIQSGCCLVI